MSNDDILYETPGDVMYPMFRYRPDECPRKPHRGPEGPNEDIAVCYFCGSPSWSLRPVGETFGNHLPDCSLPYWHESYCKPGGNGHPPSRVVRG